MNKINNRLLDKHAIISGGNRGIGLATVRAFLVSGAKCSVGDLDENPSEEIKKLLEEYPEKLHYYPNVDVTKSSAVTTFLEEAEKKWGNIHILFNNAAIFDMAPLLESDEAMYDELFAVNVKGMFFLMQKVLASMVKNSVRGSIINLSSQAGRRGEALVSHYCATKAAVISYTQSAALAMAPHHIRVNAIAPGVIDTPMWQEVDKLFAKYENLPLGEKKKQVGRAVPLGYMGEPNQIAEVAVFLASEEANYITAQTINVDGGSVMN